MVSTSSFPSILVLRARGEQLFAEDQTADCGELGDLLERMYPISADQQKAAGVLKRATRLANKRGLVKFRAQIPDSRVWVRVLVERWNGMGQEPAYLVHMLPDTPTMTTNVSSRQERVAVNALLQRVQALLERAITNSRSLMDDSHEVDPRVALLTAQIDRAQGLLTSLETQVRASYGQSPDQEGAR